MLHAQHIPPSNAIQSEKDKEEEVSLYMSHFCPKPSNVKSPIEISFVIWFISAKENSKIQISNIVKTRRYGDVGTITSRFSSQGELILESNFDLHRIDS